jgi:hypoxanthine phosphoribosyltransferase
MSKVRELISAKQIQRAISSIAQEINKDYEDKDFIIINVLQGADRFVFDLSNTLAKLRYPPKVLCITINSYHCIDPMVNGPLKIYNDIPTEEIEGKHILIVDDIIDTGHSLQWLIEHLQRKGPRTIRTCTLLDKQERREVPIVPDYYGFIIPNLFVVGYGMDLDGEHRNLPHIGELT